MCPLSQMLECPGTDDDSAARQPFRTILEAVSLEAPETLVWVRLKGWPLWPARVIKNTQDGGVLLYTFGDHLHMWSKLEDIFAFTAADAPPSIAKATLHTQSKRNRLFAKALSEARQAVGVSRPARKPEQPPRVFAGGWECSVCTLLNHRNALRCKVCSSERSIAAPWSSKRVCAALDHRNEVEEALKKATAKRQQTWCFEHWQQVSHYGSQDASQESTVSSSATSTAHQSDDESPAVCRKLRGVELGCGTARLAKAAMQRGFDMYTLDQDEEAPEYDELVVRDSDRHWVMKLRDLRVEELPTLDYLHFSPKCVSTTLLAAPKHQRTAATDYQGTTTECVEWNADMMHFYAIVQQQRSRPGNSHCAFSLEQPVGLARSTLAIKLFEQPIASGGLGAVRCTFDVCKLGGECKKPTDLWVGGLPGLVHAIGTSQDPSLPPLKWRCSRSSPCRHYPNHREVRGNTKCTTAFPHELCAFLLALVENDLSPHRLSNVHETAKKNEGAAGGQGATLGLESHRD